MPRFARFLFLSLLVSALAPTAARADEIIVKREPGASAADVRGDAGVRLVASLPLAGVQVVSVAPGQRAQALADLQEDPRVAWAEPNQRVRADTVPGPALLDPLSHDDWGLVNTGQWPTYGTPDDDTDADQAWTMSTGAGVTVAVVDSGIDAGHPDLAGQIADGGWDYVDGDGVPQDGDGHGTHVSGTIAAQSNGDGVTGMAPDAKILPLRVLDNAGWGSESAVAAAFARAGDAHVRVVNASLGGDSAMQAVHDAISGHPDTLYVVAAGNDGADNDRTPHYPCNDPSPNVLCVGATDGDDEPASFSDFGATTVDVFAPGLWVVSDYPRALTSWFTPGYEVMSGTSMATPHVAGAAALLASLHPSWNALQIKQRLLDTVDPVGSLRGLAVSGGRLNAATAVTVDAGPPAAPVVRARAGNGQVTLTWPANDEPDLAGYRVYQLARAGWLAPADTTDTTFTASGVPNGTLAQFKVTAVDLAGNESAPDVVSATPSGPPVTVPPPAPVATPAPVIVPPRAAPALDAIKLRGRVCARCRSTLTFRVSAVSEVRFTLQRRGGRRTSRTVAFPAATARVPVRRTLLGMKLTPGRWTLTLAVSGGAAHILHFTFAH